MRVARIVLLALLFAAAPAAAQAPYAVRVADDRSALLLVGPVLAEAALIEALEAGLPVRMRFRAELWKDALFDDLVGDGEFVLVVRYEPIERVYQVLDGRRAGAVASFRSFALMRGAVEATYRMDFRPRSTGRYYYLSTLELETLALSDLEELQAWLSGELSPAVAGDGNVLGALGSGARRLFIRVLRLPTRRFEARSPTFRIR